MLYSLIFPIISASILILSFPCFAISSLAWVALAPIMFGLKDNKLWMGAISGAIFGIIFLHGYFHWILLIQEYTFLHHLLLLLTLGLFFAFWGLLFKFLAINLSFSTALLGAPFIWVTIEYIRVHLSFLALPMGFLGHTQYSNQEIIQVANFGGVYIVSFIIVLFNAALAGFAVRELRDKKSIPSLSKILSGLKSPLSIIAIIFMLLVVVYGFWSKTRVIEGDRIRISLIQGNIEQEKKWDPQYAHMIMKTYEDLTFHAIQEKPDIVIWPETATPGVAINHNSTLNALKRLASKTGSYLVTGSAQGVKFERGDRSTIKYKNSAYLFSPHSGKRIDQQYDKIKLFPFGEYLPYPDTLPWHLLKIKSANEYITGREYTIFRHPAFNFCTTICWENLFPDLCRKFVQKGAQVIINITNEARFGRSAAPYQLMAISVFRAVENGVYVVRCANTGISCIIDPRGKIIEKLKDKDGNEIFVRGVLNGTIVPLISNTFYSKHGDVFAWICIFATISFILCALFSKVLKFTIVND